MMDHEAVRDLLSEYVDGDLPYDRAREVGEHLESCAECRAHLERYQESLRHLRSLPRAEPPGDLEQKIKKRIRARSRGRFFGESTQPQVLLRVPFELISLLLILFALALLYFMTLVERIEAVQPPPDKDAQEQVQESH